MNTSIFALTTVMIASALLGCQTSARSGGDSDTMAAATQSALPTTAASTPADTTAPSVSIPPLATAVVDTANGRTGIVGEVRKSPLTKGLPDDAKDYAPLANAKFVIEDVNEAVVATVYSDANGKFFVSLPPGPHLLIPEPFESIYPSPPVSETVIVPDKGAATVIFTYDTGIE